MRLRNENIQIRPERKIKNLSGDRYDEKEVENLIKV